MVPPWRDLFRRKPARADAPDGPPAAEAEQPPGPPVSDGPPAADLEGPAAPAEATQDPLVGPAETAGSSPCDPPETDPGTQELPERLASQSSPAESPLAAPDHASAALPGLPPLDPSPAPTAPASPASGPQAPAAPTELVVNGRRYALAALPPEARALFDQIRRADELLNFKREARQLLAWGQAAQLQQLRQRLQQIEPLPEADPHDGGTPHP
ncbi:MAG: DUF6447 family protein [Synechococcaceae cyanobacterium]|nr:DUF6447 family protein [Synechococcaceae cyanobacterium]